jgi:hypothetical protein
VLANPEETNARVARAFERAQSFTFDHYMEQMNEFVDAAATQPRPAQPRLPA